MIGATGEFKGVCTTGAFELDMQWKKSKITSVNILSKAGQPCHVYAANKLSVTLNGKKIKVEMLKDGSMQFPTIKGNSYTANSCGKLAVKTQNNWHQSSVLKTVSAIIEDGLAMLTCLLNRLATITFVTAF